MKSILLVSLFTAVTSLPIYAQSDSPAGGDAITQLVNIISSANSETNPEQLNADLIAAIEAVCEDCTAAQVDAMIAEVVSTVGADSPLVSTFLTSLSNAGVDADVITLSAITAGVDATTASEATAAGPQAPNSTTPPANQQQTQDSSGLTFTPGTSTPTPQGAGGNGGDEGISEVSS